MAAKKKKQAAKAGSPLDRKEGETDSEFEARRQAEYPKGVHDPAINKCGECGSVPAQGFELKMVQEDGSVRTLHAAPATPLAYQSMLAHYKFQHPAAKVPRHADDLDVPDPELLAELLDRTRDSNGEVASPKAKPAEFAA